MLIVTRKKSESVMINENIEVIIIDIQGDKVRVGINAPASIKIVRKELLETEALNKEAARLTDKNEIKKLNDIFRLRKP